MNFVKLFIHFVFRFPFLRLPVVTNTKHNDLNHITCSNCRSPLKIINEK